MKAIKEYINYNLLLYIVLFFFILTDNINWTKSICFIFQL